MTIFLLVCCCLFWSLGWTPERWWTIGGLNAASVRGVSAAIVIFAALATSKTVQRLFPHDQKLRQNLWGAANSLTMAVSSGCYIFASTLIQGYASTSLAYTTPLFYSLLALPFGHKIARGDIAAVIGDSLAVVLFLSDNWGSVRLGGVIVGLLGGITWAMNQVAVNKIGPRARLLTYGIGASLLGLPAIWNVLHASIRWDYLAYHLIAGAFTLALPLFLFTYAQEKVKDAPMQAVIVTSIEPAPAALWSFLFFHETFTWRSVSAMILTVVVAAAYNMWMEKRKKKD